MRLIARFLFVALAGLIIATQASRLTATEASARQSGGLDGALISLGLRRVAAAVPPGAIAAAAPGCTEPVALTRVSFAGLDAGTARALLAMHASPRFIYLGYVGDREELAPIAGRWAAASVLGAIGLRSGRVPNEVILVMLPSGCQSLKALDWARLSPWS